MSNTTPLISVTMTTHNRADLLLQRSIPSMLRQTYANWELLIRGDGAGRDTEFVINSFNDPRIKYKRLPRRLYRTPNEQWAVGSAHAVCFGTLAQRNETSCRSIRADTHTQMYPPMICTSRRATTSNCNTVHTERNERT